MRGQLAGTVAKSTRWCVRYSTYTMEGMDSLTIENYRCFGGRQTVRLAPLTLLVGENSTGKTSVLALIRALAETGHGLAVPDFKRDPFDLGSFDDIVHRRRDNGAKPSFFRVGYSTTLEQDAQLAVESEYGKRQSAPFPIRTNFAIESSWIENAPIDHDAVAPVEREDLAFAVGTSRGAWRLEPSGDGGGLHTCIPCLIEKLQDRVEEETGENQGEFVPLEGSRPLTAEDAQDLLELIERSGFGKFPRWERQTVFAGAPIQSKPRRTYDPARPVIDSEGTYVPAYLATMARDAESWSDFKSRLEAFGLESGLFSEIDVKSFGQDSDPFRIQVRTHGNHKSAPWSNLVDVGYGVSQALPVATMLMSHTHFETFLFQQPEVHLHPVAQAALGTMFCQLAGSGSPKRQLIVETHSDHLINRVRMDVRDQVTDLGPEDVVVLYFERREFDVKIHEITFDELGNLNGAPPNYGRFFMEETNRNLWPEDYAAVQ